METTAEEFEERRRLLLQIAEVSICSLEHC